MPGRDRSLVWIKDGRAYHPAEFVRAKRWNEELNRWEYGSARDLLAPRSEPEESEDIRTNPDTCLHRVLVYAVTANDYHCIICASCESTISWEYYQEHIYDYDIDRGLLVERPGGSGVEWSQARTDSGH